MMLGVNMFDVETFVMCNFKTAQKVGPNYKVSKNELLDFVRDVKWHLSSSQVDLNRRTTIIYKYHDKEVSLNLIVTSDVSIIETGQICDFKLQVTDNKGDYAYISI